jgi:hypothetical protein
MVLVTVAFLCLGSSLLLSFAALPTAFSAFFFPAFFCFLSS